MKLKTILTITALLLPNIGSATTIEPDAIIDGNNDFTVEQMRELSVMASRLVAVHGYQCFTISSFTKFVWSMGFNLSCNNHSDHFDLTLSGRNWIITKD